MNKALNATQREELKRIIQSIANDYGISFKDSQNHYCDTIAKSRKLSFIDKEQMIVEVKSL